MARNLLFIVPSLKRAGAEMQIVKLINGLVGPEYNLHLLVFEKDLNLAQELREGIQLHHVVRQGKFCRKLIGRIAALIDSEKIELVHCTLQISLLYGWLGIRKARRQPKLVCAIHTTINVSRKFEWADRLLYRYLLRACDSIVFVCSNQRDYWQKRFPELHVHSTVIYNGVDEKFFDPKGEERSHKLTESLSLTETDRVILCVAGFRPEKSHDILIRVFHRLVGNHRDLYLLLAGDGPLRKSIEAQVVQSGLSDRVKFLGVTDEIRGLLALASVSVLASTAVETFSMAMLESMAMETPVVATDIGGASEAIIPGITGHLVPPGDEDALEGALATCLADSQALLSMGVNARQKVRDEFTQAAMIKNTQLLIDTLTA